MKTPKYHYRIVHDWINKHYGKACKCESLNCKKISKTFEYCLKKGETHERNIDNYIQFCRSCHRLYDMTPELKSVITNRIAGKYNQNLKYGPLSVRKRVVLIDENRIFESGKDLADYLGSDKSSVYMVLSGRRKTLYGKKIKYADN
jgi:hypothetical protein